MPVPRQSTRGKRSAPIPGQPNNEEPIACQWTVRKPPRFWRSNSFRDLFAFAMHRFYLGMDRNRFNAEVRPYLTKIPIGRRGIAFDRLELDAWVDEYKSRNGRPAKRSSIWDAEDHPASRKEANFGVLTRESKDTEDWSKAVARVTSTRRALLSASPGRDSPSHGLRRSTDKDV